MIVCPNLFVCFSEVLKRGWREGWLANSGQNTAQIVHQNCVLLLIKGA